MTVYLKPFTLRETLLAKGLKVFTLRDVRLLFDLSYFQTRGVVERETKKDGILLRLKNGLYAFKTDLPLEGEIANRVYQPSYLSLETVLSQYGVLPESVYAVTSVTTKPTRSFVILNRSFTFTSIKPSAYTGYFLEKTAEGSFLIAEPEKALVDYLYFVSLGKKALNDRLYLKGLKKSKVFAYARLYARKSLQHLVSQVFSK